MTATPARLVDRARSSYRSLDGVIVVSPRLLADLADALEQAHREAADVAGEQMRISLRQWLIEHGDETDPPDGDFDVPISEVTEAIRRMSATRSA